MMAKMCVYTLTMGYFCCCLLQDSSNIDNFETPYPEATPPVCSVRLAYAAVGDDEPPEIKIVIEFLSHGLILTIHKTLMTSNTTRSFNLDNIAKSFEETT